MKALRTKIPWAQLGPAVIPAAGAACATLPEGIWGVLLCIAAFAFKPLRPFLPAAAVGYAFLAGARTCWAVTHRGAVSASLGLLFILVGAWALAAWRRRRQETMATAVLIALASVSLLAAGIGAVVTGRYSLALLLAAAAPGAVLVAARLWADQWQLSLKGLAVGLALMSLRMGVAYGLAEGAALRLSAGDATRALTRATWALKLGARGQVELRRLEAAALTGYDLNRLETLYEQRDPRANPRLYDVIMARASFAAGDYERAAMYADLATSPGPVHFIPSYQYPKDSLMEELRGGSDDPRVLGYTALWEGQYDKAAAAFARLPTREGRLMFARALELARETEQARAAYLPLWEGSPPDVEAGFGLLRIEGTTTTRRSQIWAFMGTKWPEVVVGTDLAAPDGYQCTKYRMSLGHSPATFTYEGGGRRRVVIIAEAFAAYGLFPVVSLRVDGREVHKFYMNVPGENCYFATVNLSPGRHTFSLLFENDYVSEDKSEDRNVFVREVRIGRD